MRVFTNGKIVVYVPEEYKEVSSREYPYPISGGTPLCLKHKKQLYVFEEPKDEVVDARNN